MSPTSPITRSLRFVFDLLFPFFCVGCETEGSFLCAACAQRIVMRRVPHHPPHTTGLATVYAATEYRDPLVAALIARIKYAGAQDGTRILAEWCVRHLALAGFSVTPAMLVTAVPLHAQRCATRGFNQSELIAQHVADELGLSFAPDALIRVKNTSPQTQVSLRAARIANVKNAFAAREMAALRGKTVIIIDDVTTTGATLSECARALKRAGAKEIIGLAAAC